MDMHRDEPLDPPADRAVANAIQSALNWNITGVRAFEEGLNAVYRINRHEGNPAVVKTATFSSDEELLVEAKLLSALESETDVPFPSVYTILEPDESLLGISAFVMEYCEGREVTSILQLSAEAQERLIAESGRYLATVHNAEIVDGFGPLRFVNGCIVPEPRYESWNVWFRELVAEALNRLRGEGFTTDSKPRFANLASEIREGLVGTTASGNWEADPAIQFSDYRPANLVVASEDEADSIIRTVIDIGCGPTADGLLDLALAENALVDVPFGGTRRVAQLRERIRTAYSATRNSSLSPYDSDQYTAYRLYAHTRRLGAFDYWAQFAQRKIRIRLLGDGGRLPANFWPSLNNQMQYLSVIRFGTEPLYDRTTFHFTWQSKKRSPTR